MPKLQKRTQSKRIAAFLITLASLLGGQFHTAAKDGSLDLDTLLGGDGLWQMSAQEFEKKYMKKGTRSSFRWVSTSKDSARLEHLRQWERLSSSGKGESLAPTIAAGEQQIGEVIGRFTDGKLSRVEMSIYNRGDDGEINKATYLERLRKITGIVDKRLEGVRRQERPPSGRGTTNGLLWRGKKEFFLLEYSYRKENKAKNQRFRPEFIILKVAPAPKSGHLTSKTGKMKSRSQLRKEVVREKNGDRLIKTVPMVDQGQKGYCAVASAERVMRYYGIDVNQHEMAQISNTATGGGTSGKEMAAKLRAAAGVYHTRVLSLLEYSHIDKKGQIDERGFRDMEKITKTYNRLAKKAGKKTFDIENYWIPIRSVLTQAEPELLKEARASGTKYDRFKSMVTRNVDDGVPVLWALCLGIFPEKGIPQTTGGHMRLIIGYNLKTKELIYTDSWGAGHEIKRMPLDEAYTMTEGLWLLQPAS